MFLINKLFLLLFFSHYRNPDTHDNSIFKQTKENFNNKDNYAFEIYENYDGRELILILLKKIREKKLQKNNILENEEINTILAILKNKIKIINIEMNKLEVIFNIKNVKFYTEFLNKKDKNMIIDVLYKGDIKLSNKSNFDVYKDWAGKTIGVCFLGVFFKDILEKIFTRKIIENEIDKALSDKKIQEALINNEKNDEKMSNTTKINLVDKYILQHKLAKKIIDSNGNEISKYFKQIEEKLIKDNGLKNNINEKLLETKIKNHLQYALIQFKLKLLPKETLIKILVDINNKNLFLDNYIQHLPISIRENFEDIKNNLINNKPKKQLQFYIFNGEAGSGKTNMAKAMMSYAFLADIKQHFIDENNPGSFKDTIFYSYKGSDFGSKKYKGTGNMAFNKFKEKIIKNLQEGHKVQVLIDEANILLEDRKKGNEFNNQDSGALTDFLQFLEQISVEGGEYFPYKDQLLLIMTGNIISEDIDDAMKRRTAAYNKNLSFVCIPSEDNLYTLMQDILYEKKCNSANSEEETLIYKNIQEYFAKNRNKFNNLIKNLSLKHKKIYLQSKIEDLKKKRKMENNTNQNKINQEIEKLEEISKSPEKVSYEDKEVIDFIERKLCGSMKIASIINGLEHFIMSEITNKLLYNGKSNIRLEAKKDITEKDLDDIYKVREKEQNDALKNNDNFKKWLENFFNDEKNINILQNKIIEKLDN